MKSDCIEFHTGECDGVVEPRMSLSGTGVPIKRCDYHWEKRLQKQEEFYRKDADARKVDYLDAGERYDED